ncbi:hypothetical protein HNP48_002707 [Acidovorax soli]|uniref:Uncharacterized protein n=1 Tax=Acidovorax soli TaxID=592050 RepID=A0A7X0PDQ5_9BURK|nr:hypothetical protein [Acidovorax soli]MBB6560035.1 hypothetical protein [Acidovorax soli]
MDAFARAERWQAAATAFVALLAIVPAASTTGSIFIALLGAVGVGCLAGGGVMVWWQLTPEGQAWLLAESRYMSRSTSRASVWVGNLSPGLLMLGAAIFLHVRAT